MIASEPEFMLNELRIETYAIAKRHQEETD